MKKVKQVTINESDYLYLKDISKRYNSLGKKILEFYIDEDGEDAEESGKPPVNPGDLCDIGELAASEFGYM